MERDSFPETTKLWNRFVIVRRAVYGALTENETPGVNRELKTFSWSGADAGIHDHSGSLTGTFQRIGLKLIIRGITIDDQPEYKIDSRGDLILTHNTKRDLGISGKFVSADGFDGLLDIHLSDGKTSYEAYWLTFLKTHYQLEQVVNQDGHVFDAKSLPYNRRNEIIIPGTKISLKRMLRNSLQ